MKFPSYPEYRPSLTDWVDELPEHWKLLPIKRLVQIPITDGPHETPDFIDEGVPFVSAEGVFDGRVHLQAARGFISKEAHQLYAKKYLPRKNDLLLVKAGSTTGKVAIVDFEDEFNVWSPLAGIRCDLHKAIPKFVFYALNSPYFQNQVRTSWSFGTQPNIGMDVLENLMLCVPPVQEQRDISAFLDDKVTKVDRLLDRKKQLIETLRERRSALIARSVTLGLPPDAARAASLELYPELRRSGVEWLREVPAHWDVMMLKRAWASSEYGISDSLVGTGPVKVLTMSNIKNGSITLPEEGCLEDVDEAMLLKRNDLLFNRTNSLVHVGKVGLFRDQDDDPVTFASYLVRIRTNRLALPSFMNFLLNTPMLLEFARALALPSINQANLSPTRYGQIKVALPPITEQSAIVAYLDKETARIEAMVAGVGRAIERLQEYRAALITAAVTGKIDVRGANA